MTNKYMRLVHRYLGFFLIGIMSVYALSGIVLIFRDSDFLKKETRVEQKLKANLSNDQLGKQLRIRNFRAEKVEGDVVVFKNGTYNKASGVAKYTNKALPYVLEKMTHLHKAKSQDPLFYLNVFFGVSLLFFAISSLWMYIPSSKIFKKGMYFTVCGIALTLILLFI